MNTHFLSATRAVLLSLILVLGPLTAQNVFACEMMDEIMVGDCCCVGNKSDEDCADVYCDGTLNSNNELCCERSVEVSFDNEAKQYAPIVKSFDVRSDVDPPTAIVTSFNIFEPPHARVAAPVFSPFDVDHYRSDTYLITQRLRI